MSRSFSQRLGIRDDLVLVASTGVIGPRLPVKKIEKKDRIGHGEADQGFKAGRHSHG